MRRLGFLFADGAGLQHVGQRDKDDGAFAFLVGQLTTRFQVKRVFVVPDRAVVAVGQAVEGTDAEAHVAVGADRHADPRDERAHHGGPQGVDDRVHGGRVVHQEEHVRGADAGHEADLPMLVRPAAGQRDRDRARRYHTDHDAGAAGVGQLIEHIEEESQLVLPQLVRDKRLFDLAFIDGNHRFDRVFLDLYYLRRLVRPAGIVMLGPL